MRSGKGEDGSGGRGKQKNPSADLREGLEPPHERKSAALAGKAVSGRWQARVKMTLA